ncbi:hypothetical protein GH5_04834 [Leishmania sp. Ghana 2012 LV757]|uniref:hypothetical protein n=1 Tax=Leishmania sp. Ghana 2012 LV757 TaxID=2803181 RepID=UPI001B4A445D|nr:hypothetical protein GH5_04834 [Leishmania sp. Ghana 2012 LV757]
MAATASSFSRPRARLPPLQQLPLDSITVYDTPTHCYLLGTDSLQKNFHLLSFSKHSPEQTPSHHAVGNNSVAATAGSDGRPNTTASESETEAERAGPGTTASPSPSNSPPYGLDDLHDLTNYAVYSPTEAGALVDALHREHGASLRILSAVAFLGAVRFTAGYYLVLVTERRMAGYLGVHRLFESVSVELVSLQLDPEWVAAAEVQTRQQPQRIRQGGGGVGAAAFGGEYSSFTSTPLVSGGPPSEPPPSRARRVGAAYSRKSAAAAAGTSSSAYTTSYLFQRRSLEELYCQQLISSLSRASSFFYSHSYDLTNTLQRNMLAAGAAASSGAKARPFTDCGPRLSFERHSGRGAGADVGVATYPLSTRMLQPRMQYVWNEYLLEPWQLTDRNAYSSDAEMSEDVAADDEVGDAQAARAAGRAAREAAPQYPSALSRWCVFFVHGFITQRAVVVRRPAFHTLLITLIARVSKASAGVRYLRRGLNSDGHVANHVEVEQIISDESAWNSTFTVGALSSYVQLRGSVPVRWYHPPTASRLLPKPPIVIGPHDSQWSETCLHFQHLLEQYGSPIFAHDLLKRRESNPRESLLGDAYRAAVRALVDAVDRWAASRKGAESRGESQPRVCGADIIQYESTDLRSLGQLAWNTMTAVAEQHFCAVCCFVSRPCSPVAAPQPHARRTFEPDYRGALMTRDASEAASAHEGRGSGNEEAAEVVQLQCGVVRSNCLDCIDRTNLGQLFHGLHALGEQLSALGLLRHAADVCESPAVTEMLLEMYLAMGDALATQYGGSAQVGAGVLHRGAGWDQLMGVKRLYHNVMSDRDKQEAMNLLLGRKQPQPRRGSRACNAEMHSPGQLASLSLSQVFSPSTEPSLSASVTTASAGVAVTWDGVSSGPPATEGAVAPSTSFLSGIRRAASRWWSEATSSSRTSSGAAAAAALRAAQHAAAEAEAEADYYEQVATAPRLPVAGLLASWWVQPLRRFDEWYAACGVSVRQRGARSGETADVASEQHLGEVADQPAMRSAFAPSESSASSPASAHALSTSCSVSTPTLAGVASSGTYGGDQLALRLIAAETQAQERWQLLMANVERQACLAPAWRDAATHLHHDRRSEVSRGAWDNDTAAAPSPSSLLFPTAASTPTIGASVSPHATQRSLVRSAVLPGSISAIALDDAGGMVMTMSDAALTASDVAAAAEGVEAGALSSAGPASVAAAELAPLTFSARSLKVPPCLFTEPWVPLRTTMHILPVESAAAAERPPARTSTVSAAALCMGGFRTSSEGRTVIYDVGNASHNKPLHSVGKAVALQIFGCLPPAVAVVVSDSPRQMPTEKHQPWRSPQEVHRHDAFPRIVRNSAFAQHDADLERLVYREVLWLVEGIGVAAAGVRSASVESLKRPASHAWAAQPSSPQKLPYTLSPQEVADRQFMAAFLVDLFGAPATWGHEEIIQVMQRLVYPERLQMEVLEVVRSSRVQPPLGGAELLFTGGPARAEEDAEEREQRVNAETRQYWHERLVAPAGQTTPVLACGPAVAVFTQVSKPMPPQRSPGDGGIPLMRTSPTRIPPLSPSLSRRWDENVGADGPVQAAVALLCHLAGILRFSAHDSTASGASVNVMGNSHAAMVCSNGVSAAAPEVAGCGYEVPECESRGGVGVGVLAASAHEADAAQDEETASIHRVEEALLPLLETCPNSGAPAWAYLPGLFPEHVALSGALRRQWLLCHLLQPIFVRCALTPPTLYNLLSDFFSELLLDDAAAGPAEEGNGKSQQRRRREHHVRYTFVLSHQHRPLHQQQPQQQEPDLPLSGRGAEDEARGSGGSRDGQLPYKLLMSSSPSLSFSSPQGTPNTHSASSSAAAASTASRGLNIPATLKVRHCCAALDLYRWSVAHCPLFVIPPSREPSRALPISTSSSSSSASRYPTWAAWHLLWWAVDNSFVIPVVRRRGQGTLEMLADETALFCIKRDVARVALNIERRCREDVWRPQRPEARVGSGKEVPGPSAIYGVDLTSSMLRLHRPLRRSALVGILALSESLASAGLRAATKVQEFFRDRIVHGWVRQSLGVGGSATVALFGCTAASATAAADSSPLASASSGSRAVAAATVLRRFHRLAEGCLQSVQGIMTALQHISLEILARDAAMHCYISFFVNVYNAAYVAAWLTNVKELVSSGAVAAMAGANSPRKNSHPQPQGTSRTARPRTIDLFPLPTLCNTSHACFMHAYGVVIGGVFLSLEEMKYGILGGNRAPPHCDLPLWPPVGGSGASPCHPPNNPSPSELDWRQRLQQLVPLHLRADVSEAARLIALQRHPHLQEALDFADMCHALAPSTENLGDARADGGGAHAEAAKGRLSSREQGAMRNQSRSGHVPSAVQPSSASSSIDAAAADSARQSARGSPLLPPSTSSPQGPHYHVRESSQQRRRRDLVDVWCVDVVRYLPFRIVLQLIDTYLPPPIFHLCAGSVDAEGKDSPVDAAGDDESGAADSRSNAPAHDLRNPILLDGRERVPWYLQPVLNVIPLMQTTLQSSKLGVTYAVARPSEGPAAGSLAPQVNQDANGVLLQPCRMWSSPSYYVIGGDGMSGDEAVSHSFQLLQALSGSYLGAGLYHPISLGATGGNAGDAAPRAPAQHLCLPLHADEVFAQLRAAEAAFRSALLTTDPHLFCDAAVTPPSAKPPMLAATSLRRLAPPPLSLPSASTLPRHLRGGSGGVSAHVSTAGPATRRSPGGSGSSTISCSAALQNAMKPILHEWCRSIEEGNANTTLLSRHGWKMQVTLKMVQLLEESYASSKAVQAAQAAVRSG